MFLEEWLQETCVPPRPPKRSKLERASSIRRHLLNFKVEYTVAFMTLAAFAIGFLMGYDHSLSTSAASPSSSSLRADSEIKHNNEENAKGSKLKVNTLELLGELSKQKSNFHEKMRMEYLHYYSTLFDKPLLTRKMFQMTEESHERLLRRFMIKLLAANIDHPPPSPPPPRKNNYNNAEEAVVFHWVTAGDSAAAAYGNLFNQSYTHILQQSVQHVFSSVGITFQAKNYARPTHHASVPQLAFCQEAIYGSNIDILTFDYEMTHRSMPHLASLWGHRVAATYIQNKPILFMMDHSTFNTNNNNDNDNNNPNWDQFRSLEGKGLSSILMDQTALQQLITQRIPSPEVRDQSNLPSSLQFLKCGESSIEGSVDCDEEAQHYKCRDLNNEEQSRFCLLSKFDRKGVVCRDVLMGSSSRRQKEEEDVLEYQTSWHPGWKMHQLKGHFLSYFLIETLQNAVLTLDDLMTNPPSFTYEEIIDETISTNTEDDLSNPTRLLKYLVNKEELDHFLFESSPVVGRVEDAWRVVQQQQQPAAAAANVVDLIGAEVLYQHRSICRTALLPSESRYKTSIVSADGIITTATHKHNAYDTGMDMNMIPSPPPNHILPLAFDPIERQQRQQQQPCGEFLNVDYQDFFYVRQQDDWVTTTIPNKNELEQFRRINHVDGAKSTEERMIAVCFTSCLGDGRCPDDNVDAVFLEGLGGDKLSRGDIQFEVNGIPVVGSREIEGCHFLEGQERGFVWTANGGSNKDHFGQQNNINMINGEETRDFVRDEDWWYDLRIRVNESGGSMKISSIIVL